MKVYYFLILFLVVTACTSQKEETTPSNNPFITELNEPTDFAAVLPAHIEEFAALTIKQTVEGVEKIKNNAEPTFENTFVEYDRIVENIGKASNRFFLLYWTSPDSLIRTTGLASYQKLDSIGNLFGLDKELYSKMKSFTKTEAYNTFTGHRKRFIDQVIEDFEQSGIGLLEDKMEKFKSLNSEITKLTSDYSTNMNTANRSITIDEEGAEGLPENFKKTYAVGENSYEIPAINATNSQLMSNAAKEATRKAYYMEFTNRGAEENLEILNELVQKRYEIGKLMGYDSYAGYNLSFKMAANPDRVWSFINDLVEKSKPKALEEEQMLIDFRNKLTGETSDEPVASWNYSYYRNQLLKNQYSVDEEKIREYLNMDDCLKGMMEIYQQLLGYEFRKVENPSVWHEEVEMYEVYENDTLRGQFYLDLYPRPNKESWFYGVPLSSGRQTDEGYEIPVNMLLGNFPRPTDELPSLISHGQLSTLFHEFGHIMNGMAYEGEFAYQSRTKSDFGEAMSQIFENWIWDYEMLSSFAKHYETGEVFPKEMFDKMVAAKNVTSGLSAIGSLTRCTYDMMLYDKYDPENPYDTDKLWSTVYDKIGVNDSYVEGTHPQANWIHINTHPVYYYGYLWSDVFAQDMFTQFEKNGLLDQKTGVRYRNIILANGIQRPVLEAVEDFLGRPSNNDAYIKSLGLE
ncbi:M3 family metallopeptidase [Fulvivirga lutea]|uniref:Zn-dependent oligopeptidase n=1 Tax=Fulvivirga lutea TaxID=2810512 RepID=A0A974WIH9_9BACT|nr:M3 family metallopeptidase [Fulvivirga lutea]QSE99061.1 Zn-dependent oligopeptidase [Fulvivirga lutea]